ncbi:MAG: STY4528 family pathogenicity island replication protein, partial [Gammaproteobacteria bacterium]
MNKSRADAKPAEAVIGPAARALQAHIEAAAAQILSGRSERTPQNGLLFLSSWQEAMPALVHLDPVLDPVDSRVFAVLWLWAKHEGRGATAFPSYPTLLARCNVQSRATLARSLAILRITRWVTLCRRVRDQNGRNRGNIYALHEEPLALASTAYLDPSYMAFLQSARGHRHQRVAAVAQAMLESLQTSIAAGEDVLGASPLSQADRRLEAIAAIAGQGEGSYFGLRQDCFPTLTLAKKQAPRRPRDPSEVCQKVNSGPVQKMNSARVQNLNSAAKSLIIDSVQNMNSALCSSSSFIN